MGNIILGNRYELRDKIAEGGMSTIYKAFDTVLGRIVVAKILKSEFSEDDDFLSKFNDEARAAAGLNHPNIINVYDVGKDDDIAYIVMEYVDGKNLKQIVKEQGKIREKDALSIIRQTALALNEAHSKGIIHRDIKPHNIMINIQGIVKVGDFGIARATTSTTITASGDAIGSVHYFSPEQARGGFIDERSDIYSLGIVLYELLIGKPPYDGDTPIAVALKHLHEEVKIPEENQSEISKNTQNLIIKMTDKNIASRQKNAREIISDIDSINGVKEELGSYNKPDESMESTKIVGKIVQEVNEKKFNSRTLYPKFTNENKNIEPSERLKELESVPIVSEKREKKDSKRLKPGIVLAIIISALSLSFIVVYSLLNLGIFDSVFGEKIEVPNLVGEDVQIAEETLKELSLKIQISSHESSDQFEEGIIIKQFPEEGSMIRENESITVTVSSGVDSSVEVENYSEKNLEEIRTLLEEKGIVVIVSEEFSNEVDKGIILRQSPKEGTVIETGDSVTLVVSKGEENPKVTVISFVGKNINEIDGLLSSSGFTLGSITTKESSEYQENTILEQNPVANTEVSEGTPINFVVSKKPTLLKKTVQIILPQKEQLAVTVIEKSTGETVYSNTLSTINGNESIAVDVTAPVGVTRQMDIYIDGEFYASTPPIEF